MPSKQIGQVDLETGEVLSGFVAVVQSKRQNAFYDGWFAMSQQAANMISQTLTRGEEYRVLMKLFAILDYENQIQISQAEIARSLNMSRPQVSRIIKKLIDVELLLKGPKLSNSCSYMLNPGFGWKGSAKNHHNALRERMGKAGITVVK